LQEESFRSTKKYLDLRGVKDCWFIYFAEGVVDYSYYGILGTPLPTADSLWVGETAEALAFHRRAAADRRRRSFGI